MRHFLLTTCALALCGCATTSFAPPIVNMEQELRFKRTQTFFYAVCSPKPGEKHKAITSDVDGALLLINNYLLTYRCQRDRAAEGRQFFEVPAFLGMAGAATAAALGAGPVVAIAAGAGSATLDHTKRYYAPQEKAQVLTDGLQAMLCIENEAVGIDAYTIKAISQVQQSSGTPAVAQPATLEGAVPPPEDPGSAIYVSSDRQYFEMIRSALFSVEQIVAQRLSSSGKQFDTAGVLAQIKAFAKQAEEAKTEAGATPADAAKPVTNAPAPPAPAVATTVGPDGRPLPDTSAAGKRAATFDSAQKKIEAIGQNQVGLTMIKLKQLQPKLQQCVVSAKL